MAKKEVQKGFAGDSAVCVVFLRGEARRRGVTLGKIIARVKATQYYKNRMVMQAVGSAF